MWDTENTEGTEATETFILSWVKNTWNWKWNGPFGFGGGTAFLVTGGVQGEIRDAVEVVPTVGVVRSDAGGTKDCSGTHFEWMGAGGAMGLVRHLGLVGGSEGLSRGTDVQARCNSG